MQSSIADTNHRFTDYTEVSYASIISTDHLKHLLIHSLVMHHEECILIWILPYYIEKITRKQQDVQIRQK